MDIQVEIITYEVELVTETGAVYDLSPAVIELQWEQPSNELAQRVSLTTANMALGSTWLMNIAKIGCLIQIYSDWGAGRTQLFTGKIWEWAYTSATQKEMSLVAYDALKYLQQSYDYGYHSAGQSTSAILGLICNQWGVPMSYQWERQITHEKQVFNNLAISEMVVKLLEQVRYRYGERYVCHWKEGALTVEAFGTNEDVYMLEEICTISTENKVSIHDLVTKVKIIGNADDEGRTYVEAIVDGDQTFGVMQKIMVRHNTTTLWDVKQEAQVYVEQYDTPEEYIAVRAPDVPFMKKGDRVAVCAGNLSAQFFVLGVCHRGTAKEMVLTLVRCE